MKWAHRAGKSTGIVTTTRITHASPASAYANVAWRGWETLDGKKFTEKHQEKGCQDVAAQLIEHNHFINVMFFLINSFLFIFCLFLNFNAIEFR